MNIDLKSNSSVLFAKALADPTRQKIMELICCQELNVGDIVNVVGVSQPTVSHHLAVLREAGLVNVRNEGKQTFYSLNQGRMVLCCGNLLEVFAPQSEAGNMIVIKSGTEGKE
ncbi:MAG: metalloregulator ArsR/SmtB family transcription factor [Anaerolineales bacterium]